MQGVWRWRDLFEMEGLEIEEEMKEEGEGGC
jgi:hypothetical protein